ncbi:MAG TPA: ABC transporter transmembrane domain-containing protein, partial [Candidatus Limnocylindrales bacterium]
MTVGRGSHRLGPAISTTTPVPPERRGRTVRRIVSFFRPYRRQVAIVVGAILLTSVLGLINPILLKLLIDDAIPKLDWGKLNLYVGLMIAVPIVSGLIGVGQAYLNNAIGQNVMQDLRAALYAHLQRMPLRFFTETKTGEIQSRLANDVGGVQGVVTDTAAGVASNLAVAIGTIAAMLVIDWRLTALSLGLLPFFMFVTYRVGKIRREISTEVQEALAALSATTQETL